MASYDVFEPLFTSQFIGGEWTASSSPNRIAVENPATLEKFAEIPDGTVDDIDRAVDAAYEALPAWRATPLEKRRALMQRFLEHFKAMRQAIIDLEAAELGAPIAFGANAHCEYQFVRIQSYIDEVEKVVFEEPFEHSTVIREPVGVVGCITPWNYPIGQIVQKVIPALLTGNTVVLKPSQSTPLTACLMMEAFRLADFPKGVVNLVSGRGSRAGAELALNPKVAMISFTGSTAVGVSPVSYTHLTLPTT